MTTNGTRRLAYGVALLSLCSATLLHAQMEVGTWVRQPVESAPGVAMTMKVEACCGTGRRLIYHVSASGTETTLTVESRFDGSEAPVLVNGKPSTETMAITRVDDHHVSGTLKMNGSLFGTSKGTLSADGKTLTVVNDYTGSAGGQQTGKYTEVWVRK